MNLFDFILFVWFGVFIISTIVWATLDDKFWDHPNILMLLMWPITIWLIPLWVLFGLLPKWLRAFIARGKTN